MNIQLDILSASAGFLLGALLSYLFLKSRVYGKKNAAGPPVQLTEVPKGIRKSRIVKEVMIPRAGIKGIDVKTSSDKIFDLLIHLGHSRLPVYNQILDNLEGVLYAKDFLSIAKHKDLIILQDILRPAFYVSESKKTEELLYEFRNGKIHLAVVLDENGDISGLVTMEDILAATIDSNNGELP